MTEPEELDEDLFADLYDQDEVATKPASTFKVEAPIETADPPDRGDIGTTADQAMQDPKEEPGSEVFTSLQNEQKNGAGGENGPRWQDEHTMSGNGQDYDDAVGEPEQHGTGIKEDGKMFIGGLNWETTDQSLKDYFSQFGEVHECTVMRDGATGRSRGFGFLTFKDARTVNIVMVKEHYLDGKIVRLSISHSKNAPSRFRRFKKECSHFDLFDKIDPKRAIPRDEQERTSKIFVGGVSQDATEQDFKEYFMQYGRVVDATLMIDKDTGRPRGFGFVTFDNESAVDNCLQGDLTILGKPIEVKKAQPRGNMRDEDEGRDRRGGGGGGRRGGKENDRFRDDRNNYDNNNNNSNTNNNGSNNQNQAQNQQGTQFGNVMTPQMMAQYWQRMQLFFAQQMAAVAAAQGGGMAGPMGMGAMNPAMMQQMKQMQQMQAMQQQMGRQPGSQSPHPQSPGAQGMQGMQNMQGMNPAMMQQMQQMQQMQMQSQQVQGGASFSAQMNGGTPVPTGPSMGGGFSAAGAAGPAGGGARRSTPGYNAQEQLMFEQQKYEQQQARRAAQEVQQMQYGNGPTSWEGMYDDVPQPNMGGGQGGMGRGMQQGGFNRQMSQGSNGSGNKGPQQQNRGSQGPQAPKEAPPANAPTGPKNAGVPGANYRGGGRGAHRGGFHPYARK
ncbi:hypothetical protein MMC17_009944 [Xylographa soralifera]|nr:hypothetical protein [Xylographa soralifera]